MAGDDVVAGNNVVAADDVLAGNDVVAGDDDVVAYDDIEAADDVEAGEGATLVVVADEGKKKSEGKGAVAGEGLGEAGKKRKKLSWEYVPIYCR